MDHDDDPPTWEGEADSPDVEQRPHDTQRGPVDPDIDLSEPAQAREWTAHRWTLPTIALGGAVGASARHGLELAWPPTPGDVPWATLVTNVSGCALLGVLMVLVVEHGVGHPLVRPFLGVGVLGGFTTFSTYTVQTTSLVELGHPGIALAYLFGTLLLALAAVTAGVVAARVLRGGGAG